MPIYEVLVKLCSSWLVHAISRRIHLPEPGTRLDSKAPLSVHMCEWPRADEALIDKRLEKSMALVREVSEAASNARQKAGASCAGRWER